MQVVPQIKYLNGERLQKATLAAAQWLIDKQKILNDINVFPVPDGDTGTNMAFTMRSVRDRLANFKQRSMPEVVEGIADSALMGARGNSGAILAQFFRGLAEGLKDQAKVSTENFAQAVAEAAKWAKEAVSDPKEGTILTVIQDWANCVREQAQSQPCFLALLEKTLLEARESLRSTPEKLQVLKKAGVVDAGAQGFVYLLEGVVEYIQRGRVLQAEAIEEALEIHFDHDEAEITYRYCTECVLEGNALNLTEIRAELAGFGDSIVVAGGGQKIRVHLHTDTPKAVFSTLERYGMVSNRKADDMRQQAHDAFSAEKAALAIVVDSGCDLPEALKAQYHLHIVPLRLNFGEEDFIDGITIDAELFYEKLRTDRHHPRSSQPAPADFERAYAHVMNHYEAAISIHVPEIYSGTVQSAKRAGAKYGAQLEVVDGWAVSIGLGLLALNAARNAQKGWTKEAVVSQLHHDIQHLHLYVALPTIDFLVKGGRVTGLKSWLGKLLNLRPILKFGKQGKIENVGKAIGRQDVYEALMRTLDKVLGNAKGLQMAVGHGNSPEIGQKILGQLEEKYAPSEALLTPLSPVLAVHGGPGVIGVAFIKP